MRLVSRLPGNWCLLAALNQNATVSGCPHLYNKKNTISNKMCDNPENVRPTGHQFRRLTQKQRTTIQTTNSRGSASMSYRPP